MGSVIKTVIEQVLTNHPCKQILEEIRCANSISIHIAEKEFAVSCLECYFVILHRKNFIQENHYTCKSC